jgi:hypothetical protein
MLAVWAKRQAPLLSTCAKPTLVGLPVSLGAPPVAAALLLAGAAALPLADDDALPLADVDVVPLEDALLPLADVLVLVEGVPHAASTSMTSMTSEVNNGRFTRMLLCMWTIGLERTTRCCFSGRWLRQTWWTFDLCPWWRLNR